ncbi:hypothetical protein AC623_01020 [Bacillus sp. FJAT-27231]|uniref:hypothetical protein n=1 Tax=Bacillus sp. FJAT-27231 TaxID=1679168 RepID=UPI000670A662|nr:hypothetical protein [Bacillus sp. FJAT-27231]KMY52740.1 hypothetical protein AC623_01020 [Bacillus sp. FJAT-27231]
MNKEKRWSTWLMFGMILLLGVMLLSFYLPNAKKEPAEEPLRKEKDKKMETVESGGSDLLQKPGQKVRVKDWATLELIDRFKVEKEYIVDRMQIYVKEVKLIKMTDMANEEKEYLSYFNDKTKNELLREGNKYADWEELDEAVDRSGWKIEEDAYCIEIAYNVTNKYEKEVQFFSFLDVQFGEELFFVPSRNFIASDDTFMGESSFSRVDYREGETREGEIGLLLKKLPKQADTIQFSTDDVLDGDTHELISRGQTFRLHLQ